MNIPARIVLVASLTILAACSDDSTTSPDDQNQPSTEPTVKAFTDSCGFRVSAGMVDTVHFEETTAYQQASVWSSYILANGVNKTEVQLPVWSRGPGNGPTLLYAKAKIAVPGKQTGTFAWGSQGKGVVTIEGTYQGHPFIWTGLSGQTVITSIQGSDNANLTVLGSFSGILVDQNGKHIAVSGGMNGCY
jgi:hypothetical protein